MLLELGKTDGIIDNIQGNRTDSDWFGRGKLFGKVLINVCMLVSEQKEVKLLNSGGGGNEIVVGNRDA